MNFAHESAQWGKCNLLFCQKFQSSDSVRIYSLTAGDGQKLKQHLIAPWVQTDPKLFGEGGNISSHIKEIRLTSIRICSVGNDQTEQQLFKDLICT